MVNVKKENAIKSNIQREAAKLGNANKQVVKYKAPKQPKQSTSGMVVPDQTRLLVCPFEGKYFGAKSCDESMLPTSTFHTRDPINYASDSDNPTCYGFAFLANVQTHVLRPGLTGSNGIFWDGGSGVSAGKVGSAVANYDLVRPIAGGVKLRTSTAELNASGTVHYCAVAHSVRNGIASDLPQTIEEFANHGTYGSFPMSRLADDDFIIRHLPYDNNAQEFHDVNFTPSYAADGGALNSDNFTSGWATICVLFENFKSGSSVQIEHIVHYEATVKNRNGSVVTPTAAAPFSPVLLAATKNLVSSLPAGYINDATGGWSSKVASAFTSGLKWAMGVAPVAMEVASLLF